MTVLVQPASKSVPPEALADLLWSTDPKLNGYIFGKMDVLLKIIGTEWPAQLGLYSFKHAFTAMHRGKVAGLLIGHTEEEYAANFDFSVDHQANALGEDEARHLKSALHWMDRLFPAPRQNSYYILEFAVNPDMQGTGIASQLFAIATKRALAGGCNQICLDVAANNEAVSFYEHIGFSVEIESRVPVLDDEHGIRMHLHMVLEIGQSD
ncbi:GNAT family N-acetyltransferase [Ruegeria faecimaris]|uniref:GNAT family N-acetyltransferase n=1 Tax=Ruegeria faecimaris TaxID=686389 RepID=UPI00232D26B1|nr:GNAT family N-acetyltransferase [Ruegeria faecimaris]